MIEAALVHAPGVATLGEAADLDNVLSAVLAEAGIDHEAEVVGLDVRLVEAEESADLNGRYRDKPYATNVLSFPADARVPGFWALGDLVICRSIVVDEAQAQHKSVTAHWMHMLVHGCFHLLGFDHIGDDEAEIMEAAERRVMAQLGFADPYAKTEPL